MGKTRSAFATLFALGLVAVSACVIKTGPPPESQPAPAATATPAPASTQSAQAATTAGPSVVAPTPGAATSSPAPAVTAAPTPAADAGAYDPCAAKKCGDRCNLCPPQTPGCFETALVKMCHPDGKCKPATSVDCSGGK
jgi:hypothetical protein